MKMRMNRRLLAKCPRCGTILRRDGNCRSDRCVNADSAEMEFHRNVSAANDGDEAAIAVLDRHIAAEKARLNVQPLHTISRPNRERHQGAA